MVDGDFELTGRSDQAPWIVFDPNQGQTTLNYDTGGRCRSGIRCATLVQPDVARSATWPRRSKERSKCGSTRRRAASGAPTLQILAIDLETNAEDKQRQRDEPGARRRRLVCLRRARSTTSRTQQPVLYVSIGTKHDVTRARSTKSSVLPMGEVSVHGIAASGHAGRRGDRRRASRRWRRGCGSTASSGAAERGRAGTQ